MNRRAATGVLVLTIPMILVGGWLFGQGYFEILYAMCSGAECEADEASMAYQMRDLIPAFLHGYEFFIGVAMMLAGFGIQLSILRRGARQAHDDSFDSLITEHEDSLRMLEGNTSPEAEILRQESQSLLDQLRTLPDEVKLKALRPKIEDLHERSRQAVQSVRELSEG